MNPHTAIQSSHSQPAGDGESQPPTENGLSPWPLGKNEGHTLNIEHTKDFKQ